MDKVLRALDQSDLSTIPTVLARLLTVSRDPRSHAADLAAACEMDKATSARLLRAANSVYYATENRDRVDNIKEAIVRIGFGVAEEIIMSASVSALLKSTKSIADYSSTGLWEHSVAVAIGTRLVYAHCFGQTGVDPFVAGLLHDVGIAIEHQFLFEEGFENAILRRAENRTALIEEELRFLGLTHEQLGAAVSRKWHFPDHLTEVIEMHHDPYVESDYADLLHSVRLAETMCFEQGHGYSDFSELHAQTLAESRNELGVDDAAMDNMNRRLQKEMENLHNLGWFADLRLRAR